MIVKKELNFCYQYPRKVSFPLQNKKKEKKGNLKGLLCYIFVN